MPEGFDFGFSPDGEIIVDRESLDIAKKQENELKIQLSYNRIKSISKNWFIDEVGADLEEIIGKPCNSETAEYGKRKIINVLTYDGLWDEKNVFIKAEIQDNTNILYSIYLKLIDEETDETYSHEIDVELDLVKGVHIRYGWEPRRR